MYLDSIKNYLFAIGFEEGEVAIYDIGKPGKVRSCGINDKQERFTKQTAKLVYRENSREIAFARNRGELYIGNEDGTISVWDVRIAQPICIISHKVN